MKAGRSSTEKSFGAVTHVVFGHSAGGTLKRVLRGIGCTPNVLIFPDDLSCGPFGNVTPEKRVAWLAREFGGTRRWWQPISTQTRQFWESVDEQGAGFIVWVSRRCTREYTAFLEWAKRVDRSSYEVVDITDARASQRRPDGRISYRQITGSGLLEADAKLWLRLFRAARPLSRGQQSHYIRLWKRLKSDGATLRTIRGHDIKSAPQSFYDEALLKFASGNWQKSALTIGAVMVENANTSPVSDLLLFSRVRALVHEGRLEGRGALSTIATTEIRLPSASAF